MVDSGLRDVGYNYVVLDDCWAEMRRDKNDMMVADANKFPNGIKYVADHVHEMGMLFGIYSSAGEMTCARYRRLYPKFNYTMVVTDLLKLDPLITKRMMHSYGHHGTLTISNMITVSIWVDLEPH